MSVFSKKNRLARQLTPIPLGDIAVRMNLTLLAIWLGRSWFLVAQLFTPHLSDNCPPKHQPLKPALLRTSRLLCFSTVSTGGFSTHDASLGFFNSLPLLWVSNIFMLLGAVSFALHYRVINIRSLRLYWRDEETRWFLLLVGGLSLILTTYIFVQESYQSFSEALTLATFTVISFITSTGFGAADLSAWPHATAMFLVFCSYLGGCAGSTAGGNKIIRNIITFKVMRNEMRQMLHPHGILTLRYQKSPVDNEVKNAVMAFMSIAAATSFALTFVLMATGLDFWSAFTAVAACINVLGPGFGEVSSNFIPVSDVGTWVLSFTMILGRLEYFTVLALFLPAFWRY